MEKYIVSRAVAAAATETVKVQAASTPQKRSYSTYETESKNTPVAKQ